MGCNSSRTCLQTCHEGPLIYRDGNEKKNPLRERSYDLPRSFTTLNSAANVEFHIAFLTDDHTEDVVAGWPPTFPPEGAWFETQGWRTLSGGGNGR